jgi:type VI secretion system secreted protein Hcp
MARSMRALWFSVLGLFGLHGGAAFAQVAGVLCGADIQGESEVPGATGCVDVLSWSWGLSKPFVVGGGAGQASLQDISLTKYTDTSSEDLFRFTTSLNPLSGIVEYREYATCGGGCTPTDPYLTIHLREAFVTNLSMGGSGGEIRHVENIALSFGDISYCYRPTVKGALDTPQCFAWSRSKGAPITPF